MLGPIGRIVWDLDVSEFSPIIHGTKITVSLVIDLILDGWTWDQITHSYPQLTYDDIRSCLAYIVKESHLYRLEK